MKLQKILALCLANLTLFSTTAFANPPSKREPNLRNAIMNDRRETVEFLLTHGADPNKKNTVGSTPLHLAVSLNNINIVQLLLTRGADPNKKSTVGFTPLHLAVNRNNKEIVQRLLDHGADPNIQNNYGATPLHLAAIHNTINMDIVQLLLDHDANLNIRNNHGFTCQDYLNQNQPHVADSPQDEFWRSFADNQTKECPILNF